MKHAAQGKHTCMEVLSLSGNLQPGLLSTYDIFVSSDVLLVTYVLGYYYQVVLSATEHDLVIVSQTIVSRYSLHSVAFVFQKACLCHWRRAMQMEVCSISKEPPSTRTNSRSHRS